MHDGICRVCMCVNKYVYASWMIVPQGNNSYYTYRRSVKYTISIAITYRVTMGFEPFNPVRATGEDKYSNH